MEKYCFQYSPQQYLFISPYFYNVTSISKCHFRPPKAAVRVSQDCIFFSRALPIIISFLFIISIFTCHFHAARLADAFLAILDTLLFLWYASLFIIFD